MANNKAELLKLDFVSFKKKKIQSPKILRCLSNLSEYGSVFDN